MISYKHRDISACKDYRHGKYFYNPLKTHQSDHHEAFSSYLL